MCTHIWCLLILSVIQNLENLTRTFFKYLIRRRDFHVSQFYMKFVFWFSPQIFFFLKLFNFGNNLVSYCHKPTSVFMFSADLSTAFKQNLNFLVVFQWKFPNIKFQARLPFVNLVAPYTDGQSEMTQLTVPLHSFANALYIGVSQMSL